MDAYEAAKILISINEKYNANGWIREWIIADKPQRIRSEFIEIIGPMITFSLTFFDSSMSAKSDEIDKHADKLNRASIAILECDTEWLKKTFPEMPTWWNILNIADLMAASLIWFDYFLLGHTQVMKGWEQYILREWKFCYIAECAKQGISLSECDKNIRKYGTDEKYDTDTIEYLISQYKKEANSPKERAYALILTIPGLTGDEKKEAKNRLKKIIPFLRGYVRKQAENILYYGYDNPLPDRTILAAISNN